MIAYDSKVVRDDPYIAAKQFPIEQHAIACVVGSVANAPDGSGAWLAIQVRGEDGKFIQGGWVPRPLYLKAC